jgi:myo-inositol 2-dehydrogenase / D-chiro-inositol 1-dehydrogenase
MLRIFKTSPYQLWESGLMPFRIAVIGCGAIALSHHGPAYRRYAETHPETELAACCDVSAARAEDFRRQFGFHRAYTGWQQMVEETRPDALCLNVPPQHTAGLAGQILRLGIPLLLEKPPGISRAEVDGLITCAAQTGTPNQVAFNRRHMPLAAHLRAVLAAQFVPEEIHHIHYDFCRTGRADLDFSTTAIHGVDTARFLAGSDYAEVRLRYRPLPRYGPAVANILMDGVFQSGATAQLNFCPLSGLVIERAEVHAAGQAFFLRMPVWQGYDYPGELLHVKDGQTAGHVQGPELSGSGEETILNGFYNENAAFFDAVRQGLRPPGDIASGRQAVVIAEAMRERQEWVTF